MNLTSKLKVLLINSYAMDQVYDLWEKGLCPGHHLWGAVELKKNHDIEVLIPKHEKYSFLNKIGNWLKIEFLDQQIRALLMLRKYDVIYAPYATANTKLILLCKLLGIVRKPVVIYVHMPLFSKSSKFRWKRLIVKKLILTYDTIIFLSEKMKSDLVDMYNIDPQHARKHFFVSYWGVDSNFYKKYLNDKAPESNKYIISSGHTGRDFGILIRAFEKIKFPLKIYCRADSYPLDIPIPENVEVHCGSFPIEKICEDYANARMILIPIVANPEGTFGYTSLLDAMAMGKPVIMTKNDKIDIDFHSENIGALVDQRDIDGWVQTVSELLENYQLLKEMGINSKQLGIEKFNIETFGKDLAYVIKNTCERGRPSRATILLSSIRKLKRTERFFSGLKD